MAPSISPLLVALSLLCNLAVFALLANTHIELGAVRAAAAASQPRRGLLEPPPADDDSFGVRLERLEESLGARVAALEQRADGLSARVDGADTVIATVVERIVELERAEPRAASERTATARAADSDGRTTVPLDKRVAEQLAQGERRRAQGAEPEPEPEPEVGDLVKIIKPQTVRCGGPGDTNANGAFDYDLCASDRAFAACHAAACAGHTGRRQLQGGDNGGSGSSCSAAELPSRSAAVTAECCDEVGEDCTGGHPHSCNADCAALFLPFWADCRAALGKDSRLFESVVGLCESAVAGGAPSLAEQLNLQCTDGSAAVDCVPHCSERYHGFLMLLNIEGDDSKLSCELHNSLYSWVGGAVRARRLPSPSGDRLKLNLKK